MSIIFTLLILIIVLLYLWIKTIFAYWEKRGIPHEKPTLILGNLKYVILGKECIHENMRRLYNKYKEEPYFGYYNLWKPTLIVNDPCLIRDILIKDFHTHFFDRPLANDKKADPLGYYILANLRNPMWKNIRAKLTPLFTLAKLKLIIPLIINCSEDLVDYLKKNDGKVVDAKEISENYTLDVITSCVFGIEANSFKNKNSPLVTSAKKLMDLNNTKRALQMSAYFFMQSLVSFFKLKFVEPKSGKFMKNIFWETLKKRKISGIKRNDLIDILSELDSDSEFLEDDDFLPAQAIMYLMAGHETSSSAISFTLYELSLNQEIQKKLRDEIKSHIEENGNLTYEIVQGIKYLNMVILETIRKYPVLPFLSRNTAEEYKIPGCNLIIEKDVLLFVSVPGLHYDEKYFPNPDKYNPERFSNENLSKITSYIYLPFGAGPRSCIGERFGMIIVKFALIHILHKFEVLRCSETEEPIIFNSSAPFLTAKNGIKLRIKSL